MRDIPPDPSNGSPDQPPPERNRRERGYGGGGYGGGYGNNGNGAYGGYGYGYGYGPYGAYSAQGGADFSRTLHTMIEKSWVIALCMIVFLGLGYAYCKYAPVLYSATATIQAEQDQPNILKMQMVQIKDLESVDYLQTVAQSLTSRPLLERVAETNKLWTDPRMVITNAKPKIGPVVLVSVDDIKDPEPFLAKLTAPTPDPLASNLWARIDVTAQRQLRSVDTSPDQKRFVLATALDDALKEGSLLAAARASGVAFSPETERLATNNPAGPDLARLNRLVLADAYPQEIAKEGRGPILAALDKMIKVKLRKGTRLIDITVTHHSPELTELIANSLVAEYINETAEREDTSIGLANKSLAKEAERQRKKLEESESALQAYREQFKSSSLDDRQNTVVTKLQELSTKATEAKSARIKIETDYNQALSLGTNVDGLLTVPTVAKDPTVLALQLSLTKAEDDFAALCKRYKEEHPKYIQAKTQIAELQGDITNAVLAAVQTLKSGLDSARTAEQSLDKAMQAQETAAIELSKLSIKYNVLQREMESDRALYDAVLKGMKEASVTKETQQTGIIRVVEPAYRPDIPIWPKKSATMAASGMGGMFLGMLIIMVLRVSDTSIKTVDEAERLLGISVYTAVPKVRGIKKGTEPLVVVDMPKSTGAEAFRTLRASLSTLDNAQDRRIFLFTSAMPGEGKTFCSMNYAASLAQLGLKTLLIDADMRRPSVENGLFGKATETPGLTDYLLGQKKLEEILRETKLEKLSVITGGATATSPAELLAKGGMEELIKEALFRFDRVVVDSAPINAVSDTLLMLKSVQTVCLVVQAAKTSSRYVMRCVQLLEGAEASFSGIILNQMPRRRMSSYAAYYDYTYRGKYGKEGVYGAKK
jgi:succinoglycan biosynthesis transport protein ExoP